VSFLSNGEAWYRSGSGIGRALAQQLAAGGSRWPLLILRAGLKQPSNHSGRSAAVSTHVMASPRKQRERFRRRRPQPARRVRCSQ